MTATVEMRSFDATAFFRILSSLVEQQAEQSGKRLAEGQAIFLSLELLRLGSVTAIALYAKHGFELEIPTAVANLNNDGHLAATSALVRHMAENGFRCRLKAIPKRLRDEPWINVTAAEIEDLINGGMESGRIVAGYKSRAAPERLALAYPEFKPTDLRRYYIDSRTIRQSRDELIGKFQALIEREATSTKNASDGDDHS
jgi:hypothetical protein